VITPLYDRILIRPELAPDTTDSGLHLVRDWTPEHHGTVVALPATVQQTCPDCGGTVPGSPSVQIGDVVAFSIEAGQELTIDEERYLLIRDRDLIAVLT
jgi:co-chaperonin GroES (HSP10)